MKNITLTEEHCSKIETLYERYVKVSKRYETDGNLLKTYIKTNSHTLPEAYFKATLINSCYSTRMGADRIYDAAKKIAANELASTIIKEGPEKHLDKITDFLSKEKDTKEYLPYSFFTKYFAIHQMYVSDKKKVDFPIYDSFVEKVIKHSNIYEEESFKKHLKNKNCKKNLKNYTALYWTIEYFANKLTNGNFTSLDHILWLLGKTIYGKGKKLEDFKSIEQVVEEIGQDIKSMENKQ